jgi:LCP family protein required for cell wall assembly
MSFLKALIRGPATAFSLIKDPQDVVRSTSNKTNILLLGMGGANHKGSELTDSIIVASIDLSSADTVLLSIPRDIWIDSLKTKINAVYYYGEQKVPDGGLILAKAAVEEIIGQPIHYGVTLSFEGFRRAIDLVGGIEVDVPETFDDFKYPIPGMEDAEPEELRYQHLHFDIGLQKLNGDLSLKYVRSRNAEGNQGTDFARSQRQQQVIIAFKNKVISLETILSPGKIRELVRTFSDSVKTDISEPEYLSLAKLAIKARNQDVRHGSLKVQDAENDKQELLINPPAYEYGGQWVLIGKNKSWNQVHLYIESLFYEN